MFPRGIVSLYSFQLPAALVAKLREQHFSPLGLLGWFWQTKSFRFPARLADADQSVMVLLWLGMLAQIALGIGFLVDWARFGGAGTWEFGAALLLSYPLVWVHLLAVGASIGWLVYFLLHPKKAGRALVCGVLERQVKRLRLRHDFKVVAVAGSVGKTSTKLAIADLLSQGLRVRHQTGNYNDRVTVPLVFFGHEEPNILNALAWLRIFRVNSRVIKKPYPYDVVVVELGTDAPGSMAAFAYTRPDITVVTAVSPEHMEFFGTLDAVAAEELTVFDYSLQVLVNADDIAGKYLAGREFAAYSLESKQAEYFATAKPQGLDGQHMDIAAPSGEIAADVSYLGAQGAKFALAAAAAADMLGVKQVDIAAGLPKLRAFAGRMQVLPGVSDSTLIDDTYNASPLAVCAALDVVYAAKVPQRVAILGSMNELGDYSQQAHQEVGAYCDPGKLDVVVTIGRDAEKWLAPAAKKRGCTVRSFANPYEAGEFVRAQLQSGALVLAKGSQNGVFAEEALKILLANPKDAAKLVRQSGYWLRLKAQQFPTPSK